MSYTAEFTVEGMTCGHCEMSVREEIAELGNVNVEEVSAQTGKLIVASEEPINDNAVIAAVEEAGYTATKLS